MRRIYDIAVFHPNDEDTMVLITPEMSRVREWLNKYMHEAGGCRLEVRDVSLNNATTVVFQGYDTEVYDYLERL